MSSTVPPTLYVATMASGSFDWIAAGHTEDAARAALLEAFNRSARMLDGSPFATVDALDEHYGINVKALAPGIVYRDDTIMRTADDPPRDVRSANH